VRRHPWGASLPSRQRMLVQRPPGDDAEAASAADVRALRSIPTRVADSLLTRGCRTAGDVLDHPKILQECLSELHVIDKDNQRAEAMVSACRREVSDTWSSSNSALQLLQAGQAAAPIWLPCQALTCLLGNALRPGGSILEVCGLPGTGKTQFCMQLCAAAQIAGLSCPSASSGGGATSSFGEAIYVDAEGSFVARRYAQICQALLVSSRRGADSRDFEAVLRGMHVCRTYDATELYATLKHLGKVLPARPRVRTLIVDSLAFSFRHEFGDNQPQRARVLLDIAATLRQYGTKYNLNVVVTNHMTTRFDRSDVHQESGWLVPALGETWAHQPSTQLRLERLVAAPVRVSGIGGGPAAPAPVVSAERPLGRATLTKSVDQAIGQNCLFRITESGLADAEI